MSLGRAGHEEWDAIVLRTWVAKRPKARESARFEMALQVPEHVRLPQFAFPGDDSDASDLAKTIEDLAKTIERRPRPNTGPKVAPPPPPPAPANTTQELDAIDLIEEEPIERHPPSVSPVALDV